ncbi:hypothetical protein Hanom_Chr04g00297611 [Helianthus anomalus]
MIKNIYINPKLVCTLSPSYKHTSLSISTTNIHPTATCCNHLQPNPPISLPPSLSQPYNPPAVAPTTAQNPPPPQPVETPARFSDQKVFKKLRPRGVSIATKIQKLRQVF